MVLILNGGKHKIPAKETLSFKIKPGDFTYQIQDITGKITRTIHMGDKYGIVVRSTEDNKPPKEVPIPVKKTSTLVFESQVKDNTTVVINGKQYDIPSGKTISIDVSVGKCEMHVLGFSQTTTTDCAAGGSYAFAIKLAKNYNTTQPPTTYRPTYQFPIDRSYQRCR